MQGTVKWFSEEKGYGFIAGEDGKDYFTHASYVTGHHIEGGDSVEFEIRANDKGPAAVSVKKVFS